MPLTAAEAIARARAQVGTIDLARKGMCLKVSRSWPLVDSFYTDASAGWRGADFRHPGNRNPPSGAFAWWTGGPEEDGHVAISDGGGFVISTDWDNGYRAGALNRVSINELTRRWGLPYEGWSEDINEVRVWFPTQPGGDEDLTPEQAKALEVTTQNVEAMKGDVIGLKVTAGNLAKWLEPTQQNVENMKGDLIQIKQAIGNLQSGGGQVDLEALATRVADKLAERLKS